VLSEIPSFCPKDGIPLNSQLHPALIKIIQNPHFGDMPHFQSHCSGLVHAPHKVLPKQEVEMELPIPGIRDGKSMDWLKGNLQDPRYFMGESIVSAFDVLFNQSMFQSFSGLCKNWLVVLTCLKNTSQLGSQ